MEIIVGNDLTLFLEKLRKTIDQRRAHPLETVQVACACYGMQEQIMLAMARQNIFFGVKFISLDSYFRSHIPKCRVPTAYDLEMALHALPQLPPELEDYVATSHVSLHTFFQKLSLIFHDYFTLGPPPLQGFSQSLFHMLCAAPFHFEPMQKALRRLRTNELLCLFGYSFLPALYLEALEGVEGVAYLFSPCQEFWTEESKRDAQSHELLASWGKLGREMEKGLEVCRDVQRHYALPEGNIRLLEALQLDVLFRRDLRQTTRIEMDRDDPSLQIHGCASVWQEIEVVYSRIVSMAHEEIDFSPEDVLILAKNPQDYLPYIHTVFSRGSIPYFLFDVSLKEQYALVRVFLDLFDWVEGRFHPEPFLDLWDTPQHECLFPGIHKEHVEEWIERGRVVWGLDLAHRDQVLRESMGEAMHDRTQEGTWEGGFSILLDQILTVGAFPLSQAQDLGAFMVRFRSLTTSLCKLTRQKVGLREWIVSCTAFAQEFFAQDPHLDVLCNLLTKLSTPLIETLEMPLSFSQVRARLETLMEQKEPLSLQDRLGAVGISSLSSNRAVRKKYIFFLGLNQNMFANTQVHSSLHQMHQSSIYLPTTKDQEEYALLETLFAAKRSLHLCYQTSKGMCHLLAQLLDVMDQSFHFGSDTFSQTHLYHHTKTTCVVPQTPRLQTLSCMKGSLAMPKVVTPQQILSYFKDPLKAYCQYQLGMRLKDAQLRVPESTEPYGLSALDLWIKASKQPLLPQPLGPFKHLVLSSWRPQDTVVLEWVRGQKKSEWISANHLLLPSIASGDLSLEGMVELEVGGVEHPNHSAQVLFETLPKRLFALLAELPYVVAMGSKRFCEAHEDPATLLLDWMAQIQRPQPPVFHPRLIESFVTDTYAQYCQKLDASKENPFHYYSAYWHLPVIPHESDTYQEQQQQLRSLLDRTESTKSLIRFDSK